MDHTLFDILHERAPKFNQDLVQGLAVKQLAEAESYIRRILKTAEQDLPPELKFVELVRCSPEEEYREVTKRLTSAGKTLEVAPSNTYMVKAQFSFKDEMLDPTYFYMPYVEQAGLMRIRASVFAISPVMADKAVSVGPDYIFIPLNRAKMTFNRLYHHVLRDGERESVYVYWSLIYNLNERARRDAKKRTVVGHTTLGHYLFAKYGLKQTFAKYCNTDIQVGNDETITEEKFPKADWVIVASTGFKPKGVREKLYMASNLRVAIARKDYNLATGSLLGALFYVVDHFPQRVYAEYLHGHLKVNPKDKQDVADVEDEKRLWQTLLGLLLFGCPNGEGKLIDDIQAHLLSLDSYIDTESKTYLKTDDIYCENLYDLLMHVVETFSSRVTHSGMQVASLYDKRLVVLRYLLRDLTSAINTFMFKMSGDKRKVITKKDVQNTLKYVLKPLTILKINRGHGEVNPISTPSDNMYFKITSQVIQQSDSSKTKTKSKANPSDPSKFLHVSIAEVGSYNAVSKAEPTGRSKLNPYLKLSPDGMIMRDPAKAAILDRTQKRLTS